MKTFANLLFVTLLAVSGVVAQDTAEGLNKRNKNKLFALLTPSPDPVITVNEAGKSQGQQGNWSEHAHFVWKSAKWRDGAFVVEGERRAAVYDKRGKQYRPLKTEEKIQIRFPAAQRNVDEKLVARIANTFRPDNNLERPSYEWAFEQEDDIKPCVEEAPTPANDSSGASKGTFIAQFTPDPAYSETARRAKVNGTVRFEVDANKAGRIVRVRLLDPLGAGLDEQGVATLKQWVFSPAVKNGCPVPRTVQLEMNFSLY